MTAFRASYADWKLVKTRGVVQVVFEVPLEDHDAAYDVLGGMPNPSKERWFGIAPLSDRASLQPQPVVDRPPAGARRDWRSLQPSQQAGIRCEDPTFEAFLREEYTGVWDEMQNARDCVCAICGVESRAELGPNRKARVIWHQLDEQYVAWKALEHA